MSRSESAVFVIGCERPFPECASGIGTWTRNRVIVRVSTLVMTGFLQMLRLNDIQLQSSGVNKHLKAR